MTPAPCLDWETLLAHTLRSAVVIKAGLEPQTHTFRLVVSLGAHALRGRLQRLGVSSASLPDAGHRPPALRARRRLVLLLAVLRGAPSPSPPVRHLNSRGRESGSARGIVGARASVISSCSLLLQRRHARVGRVSFRFCVDPRAELEVSCCFCHLFVLAMHQHRKMLVRFFYGYSILFCKWLFFWF